MLAARVPAARDRRHLDAAGWLRWATPLGWAEELRPFAGAQPLVLLLPCSTAVAAAARRGDDRACGATSAPAARGATIDAAPRGTCCPRRRPGAAQRAARRSSVWLVGVGVFAFIVGVISTSFVGRDLSSNVRESAARSSAAHRCSRRPAPRLHFLFFVLAISLFALRAGRSRATRGGRPAARDAARAARSAGARWLGGRCCSAAVGALRRSACSPACSRGRAPPRRARTSRSAEMLEAGLNCLPAALLFLGLAALAFALAPRASAGIAYGLVSVAFLWQLVGALLGAPEWLARPLAVPPRRARPGAAVPPHCGDRHGRPRGGWCVRQMRAFRRRDLAVA